MIVFPGVSSLLSYRSFVYYDWLIVAGWPRVTGLSTTGYFLLATLLLAFYCQVHFAKLKTSVR